MTPTRPFLAHSHQRERDWQEREIPAILHPPPRETESHNVFIIYSAYTTTYHPPYFQQHASRWVRSFFFFMRKIVFYDSIAFFVLSFVQIVFCCTLELEIKAEILIYLC